MSAQADLNYFWDQATAGGVVTNDLQMITSTGGFTAQLLVNLSSGSLQNTSGNDNPNGTAGDSYLGGGWNFGESTGGTPGFLNPLVAGVATNIGGSAVGAPTQGINGGANGSVNAAWLFDLASATDDNGTPGDESDDFLTVPLPTGTIIDPVFLGRINLTDSASGTYSIRMSNSGGDVVQVVGGNITNGVLSQRLAGDANMDGTVNGQDLAIIAANFGGSGQNVLTGDFSGDGSINGQDLAIIAGNFGASSGALPDQNQAAVPEPTSLAILGLGGLILARRRRR